MVIYVFYRPHWNASYTDCRSATTPILYIGRNAHFDFSRDKSLIVVCVLLIPTIREQLTPSVFAFN